MQSYLEQFGQLLDMRVFRKNCYGFAQYAQHSDAVMAILGKSQELVLPAAYSVYIHASDDTVARYANAPPLCPLLPAIGDLSSIE
jgi:hypothetical protein